MKLSKMKSNIPTENELVMALVEYFRNKNKRVLTEVQLFERFIDIVAIDDKNKLYAIEAKLKSPSQAFKQALRYRIFADYVYVATQKNGTNKTSLQLADKTGIGLILVNKIRDKEYVMEVAMEARFSDVRSKGISEYILELV
jgi:hypothetical protein